MITSASHDLLLCVLLHYYVQVIIHFCSPIFYLPEAPPPPPDPPPATVGTPSWDRTDGAEAEELILLAESIWIAAPVALIFTHGA
ncbi:hypothetical protein DPMN_003956 [Dreissena polymorpha]|uniref:Uncharacterized protein n=1 Tax=Dreissena polymorpha TaxID=45954 RepID=A0A9D4MQP5_DREPO|nr:hypothetical protein DPMN_003956 [Dreissena polymorpha]